MNVISKIWGKYTGKWQILTGWKLFMFYLLHYTLLFLLLQKIIFSPFYNAGKSFIWIPDAYIGHLPRMIYISQTFRDGIQNLLAGNGWSIPLYDFRLWAARLDLQVEPLQWLSVLWPWDKQDFLYDFLVILRYYLIGLAFSVMGFFFKQKPLPIIIGAISYTFCGFSIYAGVRHPWFLAPMIFLPFLIIGAERIIVGKKSFLLTAVVFLAMISNLYFACMLAIIIVIYILIRFLCINVPDKIYSFGKLWCRLLLCGGSGMLLSGIVVLPTLYQMLNNGRIGRDVGLSLHYGWDTYKKFFTAFVMIPNDQYLWSILGFSCLAIPCVILLFCDKRKEYKSLKILFLVLTLMFCSPIAAYVMSGFNALSARWCFAYALCVSAIIMFELPRLQTESKSILVFSGCMLLVYVAVCYFIIDRRYYHEEPLFFLTLIIMVFILLYSAEDKGRKIILPVCLCITCLSVYYSAFIKYDSSQQNYIAEFVDKGGVYQIYGSGQYALLAKNKEIQNDESFFRVSAGNLLSTDLSMSFYYGLNGTSFASNIFIPAYKSLERNLEIRQTRNYSQNFGIGLRAPILSLLNVKYFIAQDNVPVPYGFKKIDTIVQNNISNSIYMNQYVLPIGYTYENYIDMETYNKLSSVEKQEVMLQSVVLESQPDNISISNKMPEILSKKIPIKITALDGVDWRDGKLEVEQENATMVLSFQGEPKSDLYLRIVNLDLTSGKSTRRWNLSVRTENTFTWAAFHADEYLYSTKIKTQTLFLGNSTDGYTTCTLTFPQKGTFILDDIEIWSCSMNNYAEYINRLKDDSLTNVEINWNSLTGNISLNEDKILCFSIPYEKTWSVYVDGKKRELLQTNIGFMGVELEVGSHTVKMQYYPEGFGLGLFLSICGLSLCVLQSILNYKKVRQKNEYQ